MPSFLSQVLGTWELLSYTAVNVVNTEDIFYPMGKECKGHIMYTEDGYVSSGSQVAGTVSARSTTPAQ